MLTHTMTSAWGDDIKKEEQVVENTLCTQTQGAEPDGRVTYGHECHQVHSLVFGLFQQRMDPARIAFHETKGAEVPEGCGDHTGNCGSRLEKDDPLVELMAGSVD